MKSLLVTVCLMSLVFVQTSAAQQSTVSGQVRLSGGLPVAGAQVMLFDLTDLQRGPVAQATTAEDGQFALVALGGSGLPQRFALGQNYPNPFNPSTIIPYQLPTAVQVRLEIFNLLGQRIATLIDEERPAGFHTAQWDATNAAGQAVAAGVYLYRLTAGGSSYTRRMVLVDGQAGVAAVAGPSAGIVPEAAERASYGIAVVGVGLAAYVDADFRVEAGMAPVELVVEPEAPPARGKVVPSGLVGDVNADGRIDPADALLVMLYSLDPARFVAHSGLRFLDSSRSVAHNGPRFLGDVNADGRITPTDARLIMAYVANPFDKTLPAGLGQPVGIAGKRVASPSRSLVFILDVSGSMDAEVEGGGETRLEAAKAALSQVLGRAATDGSWEYALTTFGESSGCSVDVPIAFTSDPQRVVSYASGLSPNGGTPLAEALLRGERLALETASSDSILLVLLSDGQESCGGDPVAVAQQIREQGQVQLISVNAIGFGVEPGSNEDQQIQAIAQAGGGDYFRASDTEDLTVAIGIASDIIPPESFLPGEISRLTNHSADDGTPSWSPDGRRIAFTSSRDGNNEIYVVDSDGSNLRRLTNDPADDGYPSWSPDGRSIVFHSSRDGNGEIYAMGSDGSNPRRLTNDSANDVAPVWSPDGRRIAFMSSRDGNWEIYSMDSDGNNPRRLTSNSATDGIPSWSPDSRQIAFESSRDGNFEVYSMGSDGNNPRRLTNNPAVDGFPVWSPDGRHIAFHSSRDDNFEIYVMRSDGSDLSRLTNDPGNDYAPVWSPDGRNITFESSRDGNLEIYSMELREVRGGSITGAATTMYWTDFGAGKIQRANLDGSDVQDLVTGLDDPNGLALDVAGGKMYWTDQGTDKIQRANLDGSNIQDLVTGGSRLYGLALDVAGGKMYWTDVGVDKIQRANLDGSNIQDLVTGGSPGVIALDVAGGKMYWTDVGVDKIQRANLDGSNVQDLVTGLAHPEGLALDVAGGKMYWAHQGASAIQRANLDGSNIQDLVTGLDDPEGLALDVAGGKMYWADWDAGKIQRANLDGSNIQDLVTGLDDPVTVALDYSLRDLPPSGPINPSDANALSRVVSIPNSRLISGLPPAPSTSSAAPDISGNLDQLISSNGSTFLLPFQYSTNSDLSGCYIWIRGADGYFDVPYTGSSGDRGTLNIPIGLPTNVEQGSFSVSYCVYDDRGRISNILSTSINVERLGTGSLQISLAWDSGTDLDLWVTDTSGTKIYYDNRSSSTGGALDRDDIDGFGPENIYWSQAPNGTYKVEVNYYRGSGGSGTSNYTVTVSGLGTSRQFTGTLTQKGQTNFVVNILKQGNRLTFDTSE